MSRPRKKASFLRRLTYLLVLATGGSAGVGGWLFQDHPRVQALWTLVSGNSADATKGKASADSLLDDVAQVLKPADDFSRPGIYQVAIKKVQLDPALFKAGHTVDIQARVQRRDAQGKENTLWESKKYGERLAVAGTDELSAGWPQRAFQVEWNPGEEVVLEVYDAKPGLFVQPRRLTLTPADPEANVFPLKSGDFPLEPAQQPGQTLDPRVTHVVLESQRVGDLRATGRAPAQVAERPIVIK
jgi:hypothetical protein